MEILRLRVSPKTRYVIVITTIVGLSVVKGLAGLFLPS